ncbi:hypothetical protein AX15_005147 [Amanita polypyramis BW_CC]|nr:hypothetical protein AX15_005147 [Amanita polypyramis BW_CC]
MAASTRSMLPSVPSDFSEPVLHVKLFAALRSGDPALIHPFLAEIGKDRRASEADAEVDIGAAALHLAIRCASVETVVLLLSHRAISPNGVHPPGSGTSALHLAASLGRMDIVNLLLDQPLIDDSHRDTQGRTCRDVAKSRDIIRAIDDSRSLLNATFRSELHSYILSPLSTSPAAQYQSPSGLVALLESPRAKFIDLSYLDDDSGTSLLHEAARRKDLRLIELAVRAGADVFVRNRKGKTAYEGAGKDDQVRVFLRQYANHDNTLIHTSSSFNQLPTLKGYLNKYTNVAKGYNTRWFVLRGGILSYYRHQADETVASRGSISMKNAILKPSHDKLRFEVHSIPARTQPFYQDPSFGPASTSSAYTAGTSSSGSIQKWYLKANHPVEAARWMQAIERSVQHFTREREAKSIVPLSDKEDFGRRRSGESDSSFRRGSRPASGTGTPGQTLSSFPGASLLKKAARSGGSMVREVRDMASLSRGDVSVKSLPPAGEHKHALKDSISISAAEMVHSLEPSPNSPLFGDEYRDESYGDGYGRTGPEDVTEDNVSSTGDSLSQNVKRPPYEPGFVLHANSVTTQLELTTQLAAGIVPAPPSQLSPSASSASSLSSSSLQHKHQQQLHIALSESLTNLTSIVQDYIKMVNEREKWFRRRLGEEQGRQRVWEESLKVVVKEGEDLEKELKARSRRRGSAFTGVGTVGRPGVGPILSEKRDHNEPESGEKVTTAAEVAALVRSPKEVSLSPSLQLEEEEELSPVPTPSAMSSGPQIRSILSPLSGPGRRSSITSSIYATDEEDEFFDAIESNNLPNLIVHSSFTPSRPLAPFPPTIDFACYTGYNQLRTRLALSADNRPSTSLWSVLKHSIGKDLTRISFPVFFNEPTSMLQRMAEDMEFSECLDAAARESDPLRRIAYVAAFAMSNYSSTIGRIAKPFNPMLVRALCALFVVDDD